MNILYFPTIKKQNVVNNALCVLLAQRHWIFLITFTPTAGADIYTHTHTHL